MLILLNTKLRAVNKKRANENNLKYLSDVLTDKENIII